MLLRFYIRQLSKILSKSIIILIFLVILSFNAEGQRVREEIPPFRERLFFGGNFGLQLGTLTDIQVSPVVGLWVLPRVAVALGPDYRFYKYKSEKTSIYGAKGYMKLVLVQDISSVIPFGGQTGIFLHCEDELLSLESYYWKLQPYSSERFNINTVLAGGGISQHIGRRSTIDFIVLWTLNESIYDVYSNPEIRVSFNF